MNKIDLVPTEVWQQVISIIESAPATLPSPCSIPGPSFVPCLQWVRILRREFPALPFKAATQEQRSNISGGSTAFIEKEITNTKRAGAIGSAALLQLIKNFSRNHNIKSAVTVGIIGYPNVGKSSVINSLKRSRAVGVSPTPGFTKTLQEVQIDKKVKVIDCPGIIFDDGSAGGNNSLLLQNCVSVEKMEDPEGAVASLLQYVICLLASCHSIPH